jgi:hypothetical protein
VASTELRLYLTDFVSEEIANSFAAVRDHISISSAMLCEYLAEAEDYQGVDDLEDSLETPLKLVGPLSPSTEELTPQDESKFAKEEEKDADPAEELAGPSIKGPKA